MILVCKIQVYKKFQKVQHIFSETWEISLNFSIGQKLPLTLSKYTPSSWTRNWKLSALEIVDEDDFVKLAGAFSFLFLIALCSACLISCVLSESFTMGSCSYSCTIPLLIGRLTQLVCFFSLPSLELMLSWQTDLQYYLSIFGVGILVWQKKFLCWNQTGLYYLSFLCRVCLVFHISSQEVPCFFFI